MIKGAIAIFKRDFKKFLGNPFVIIFTLLLRAGAPGRGCCMDGRYPPPGTIRSFK